MSGKVPPWKPSKGIFGREEHGRKFVRGGPRGKPGRQPRGGAGESGRTGGRDRPGRGYGGGRSTRPPKGGGFFGRPGKPPKK